MRFGDERESSNFEDATGRSGMRLRRRRRRNALGCLLPLVASRFGIGGVIVLVIGYFLLSSLGGWAAAAAAAWPGDAAERAGGPEHARSRTRGISCCRCSARPRTCGASCSAGRYTPTTLVAYSRAYQSGCGAAQSAMGPFYCPTDKKIYLDTEFFNELSQRFQAPGDFAQAYVDRARGRPPCPGPDGHARPGA